MARVDSRLPEPRAEHFPEAVDSLGRYIIQLIAMSATGASP